MTKLSGSASSDMSGQSSDKEKALHALTAVAEICSASKAALIQHQPSQDASRPPLDVLRKDFLSILTLLYTLTTKVTLTLRPGETAYTASFLPLQDLSKYISSLTTCATLFYGHGRTLFVDVRKGAQNVLENLNVFSVAFVNIVGQGEASTEDYLVKTGAVHDSIDQLRRDLPEDNVAAVRGRWSKDREMLEDSLAEVGDMVENGGGSVDEDDFDDGFDDEWDELGLGASKKMTPQELERTKKVHPLLRMVVLLHKRVLLDILNPHKGFATTTDASLDKLPERSHSLLLAVEESTATLYSPQETSTISSATHSLAVTVKQLQTVLGDQSLLDMPNANSGTTAAKADTLANKMAAVSVNGSAQKKTPDIRKWFDTCFNQIDKLSRTIIASLDEELDAS